MPDLKSIISHVKTAEYLAALLSGNNKVLRPILEHDAIEFFYSIHKDTIKELLHKKILQYVQPSVLEIAYTSLIHKNSTCLNEMELLSDGELTAPRISEGVIQWIWTNSALYPNKETVIGLWKLASVSKNVILFGLCLVWQENLKDLKKLLIK